MIFRLKNRIREVFTTSQKSYPTLDGLRGIAILIVMFFHCCYAAARAVEADQFVPFIVGFPPWLRWVWQSDKVMEMIFLASGFLIGDQLLRRSDSQEKLRIGRFYGRRILRILPLFLLSLTLSTALNPAQKLPHVIPNLLFIDTWLPDVLTIVPGGWAISVFIHFYLLAPILILCLSQVRQKTGLLILLFAVSFLFRYLMLISHPVLYQTPMYQILNDPILGGTMEYALYSRILTRFGPLILGILLAHLHLHENQTFKHMILKYRWFTGILFLVSTAIIWLSLHTPYYNPESSFYNPFSPNRNLLFLVTNRNLFSLGIFGLTLLSFHDHGFAVPVRRFLSFRIWRPFSQMIFPLYLFHFPFMVPAAMIVFSTADLAAIRTFHLSHIFLVYILMVCFTFVFALIVHILIESPVMDLRGRNGD